MIYSKYIKRLIDIILSFIAIIISTPILFILYMLVKIKLGKPVLFCQKRPGLNEKIFILYKFRTMKNEKDNNGLPLSDQARLTTFGKKLRATSLDELPELFNILKGDMSFVGPRPQLVKDMVFMNKAQHERHRVRPGLTGLAQINGRNNITWEKKIEYDLEYIEKITFITDMKILINTIFKVLKKQDISTNGMETSEDFGDYLLNKKKISLDEYNAYIKYADEIQKDLNV